MDNVLELKQKRFRASGMVMFSVALGLLISRIVASFMYRADANDTVVDVVFTCLTQIVFLGVVPFLIYKFALRESPRGIMELSNYRKVDYRVLLLCVPLGVAMLCFTAGVSTMWYVFLTMFGYSSGGGTTMPETFNFGLLILDLALTGILPAVFEEFTNRGAFLTAMRSSFSPAQTVLLCGIAFGLFHQNITQVFYTFFFGVLCAVLVLRTKSVYPGMIVHFINNGLSVYLDYAAAYGLPLGGLTDWLYGLIAKAFPLVGLLWLVTVGAGVGIVYLIFRLTSKKKPADGEARITAVDGVEIEPLAETMLYKPVLRDWAFYIGALVVTAFTTCCTLWWGIL